MKIRVAVAILLLAILATSPMLVMMPLPVKAGGVNPTYITFGDGYMSDTSKWAKRWGTGTVTITNPSGPGVRFDFVGADKVGVADEYVVEIPVEGEDLTGYDGYELYMKNVGSNGTNVHLFMNTGHTGGGADPENDTFWGGPWVWLNPGETKLYTLNFSYAEAYNIADDPDWPQPEGSFTTVFRLDEVTKIGFEVDPDPDPKDVSVIACRTTALPELYVNPPTVNKDPIHNDTSFFVDIVIENYTDFYAFDINMTWNGSLLEFESAEYSTYLTALWGTYGVDWKEVLEDDDFGTYNLVATRLGTGGVSSTGAAILFRLTLRIIETCNFPLETAIHFEVHKLSNSATPVPDKIIHNAYDGMYYMSATTPELTFDLIEPDGKPFEYCKTFLVRVNATSIHDCSPIEDYDVTIAFASGMAVYTAVSWGIFGAGTVEYTPGTPTSTVRVYGAGSPQWGDDLTLFNLTFHVEYDDSPEYVWKYLTNEHRTFGIGISGTLSFGLLGTIDEPVLPLDLTIDVYFIRGDVDSNGEVDIFDLQAVGYNYGDPGPSIYDLNNDNLIDIFDIVALATNYGYGS